MKKSFQFMAAILLMVLLQSCGKEHKSSWATENNCELPCWNEVNVGSTTKTEFLQIINRLENLDQLKIIPDGEPWDIFSGTSYFTYKNLEIDGVAYYSSEKLVDLTFSGDLRTTFGEMVDLLGEPKYILTIPLLRPTTHIVVTAIYPSVGIAFTYSTLKLPRRQQTEIGPEIPLGYISIFDPEIYEDMINASLFSQGFFSGEETRDSLRTWDGYGVLLEKYPLARKK